MKSIDVNSDDFWRPMDILELAKEQNVGPAHVDELKGKGRDLWETDEEFERFLEGIHDRRHELSPA